MADSKSRIPRAVSQPIPLPELVREVIAYGLKNKLAYVLISVPDLQRIHEVLTNASDK